MVTKTIKTKAYLEIVQNAKDCIAGLPDKTSLNSQRVADDIIAKCDGDLDKIKAAFKAYRKQTAETNAKSSLVQNVLNRRRNKQ